MSDQGLNDEELHRLIDGLKVPIKVSMLSPLDVYVDTATLRKLIRDSLASLEASRDTSDIETRALEYAIQQRIDFLAWLHARGDEPLFMSMYPADVEDDERLDELFDRIKDL